MIIIITVLVGAFISIIANQTTKQVISIKLACYSGRPFFFYMTLTLKTPIWLDYLSLFKKNKKTYHIACARYKCNLPCQSCDTKTN